MAVGDTKLPRVFAMSLAVALGLLLAAGAVGRGPLPTNRYGFLVKVVGLDDTGNPSPLTDAVVSVVPGASGGTNGNGLVWVAAGQNAAAGDYVTISAEKDGYVSQQLRTMVLQDNTVKEIYTSTAGRIVSYLLGKKTPMITFTLAPETDAGPSVDLVVQVKDGALNPVPGAVVGLDRTVAPFGSLAQTYTDVDGEARFVVPSSEIESGLQAKVFAGTKGKKFSDVPTSVLHGGGQRIFLVVLSGTWTGTWHRAENGVDGDLVLVEDGEKVSGRYSWNDASGRVSGTVSGDTFTGGFNETHYQGSFTLTLDGKHFTGSYTGKNKSTGGPVSGPFDATCTAGDCLQN